ncbi:aspartic peptidase domain-containing protein [Mycena galericulata]|nr:aspartic peptidase domain-containing protein [Mycena galericulata]
MHFAALVTLLSLSPVFTAAEPRHFPIRSGGRLLTPKDHFAAAERTKARYGFKRAVALPGEQQRRGTTEDLNITDLVSIPIVSVESSFRTRLQPQHFNLALDTGSSDLWVAATSCSGCPSGYVPYNSSASSTAVANGSALVTTAFGTGSATGSVFKDTIQMVVAASVSTNLIVSEISGVVGLAFQGTRENRRHTAAAPEMGMWLARAAGTSNTTSDALGGVFTFGGTNTSLYAIQDVEFLNLTGPASTYWMLNVSSFQARNQRINITRNTSLAAFDTGTTGIGGPPAEVEAIWATVPDGFYQFPCNTLLDIAVSFVGSRVLLLNEVDMNLGPISGNFCLGAIFALTPDSASAPGWVFGTAFLVNYDSANLIPPYTSVTPSRPTSTATNGAHTALPNKDKGALAGGVIGGLAVIFMLLQCNLVI